MATLRQILCALTLLTLLMLPVACRQQSLSSSDLRLEVSVNSLLVGETQVIARLRDQNGNAVDKPGRLSLRGDMDHAGMEPVFAEASAAVNGVFTLPFEWTMAGSWILEAQLNMESGDGLTETFRYEILSSAAAEEEEDMPTMEHSAMRDGAMGESSAVYMQIENRGATAVIIAAASASAAHAVEFHRSLVADDIARMDPVESLVIPAGGRLELRPGGLHMMLLQVKSDMASGSSIALDLDLASGETLRLSVPVMNMAMPEDHAPIVLGDLVFSQLWARPASAGAHDNHVAAG